MHKESTYPTMTMWKITAVKFKGEIFIMCEILALIVVIYSV